MTDLGALTVQRLRWILREADGAMTLAEALEAATAAEQNERDTAAHLELQAGYDAYLARRRAREREHVQRAYDEARRAAIAAAHGLILPEVAAEAARDAAAVERLRFSIFEPALEFQAWVDAGLPEVRSTRPAEFAGIGRSRASA
jgi:hypothetical protein